MNERILSPGSGGCWYFLGSSRGSTEINQFLFNIVSSLSMPVQAVNSSNLTNVVLEL